ncbi:MAG TPA: hypothetical protein VK610_07015, partial [Rhodothermales bacterium]|nr:hypothetical protein [Rhodothermales bacterium]
HAQTVRPVPAALAFLDLAPAPAALGFGDATVALPTADAQVALANPALLGLVGRDLTAATSAGPGTADWRGYGDITLRGVAQMVGASVRPFGMPLSVGASYTRAAMGYGTQTIAGTEATYRPTDRYDALSLGAATTGAVRVAFGATGRYVSSTDRAVARDDGAADVNAVRGVTMDLGVAVSADAMQLAGRPQFTLPVVGRLRPALEATVGYTQAHLGGRVRYTGGDWLPLPRTARAGWSVTAGIDRPLGDAGTLRLVSLDLARQAESRLVHETPEGYGYSILTGDMGAADALLGRGDALVTGRRGLRVALLETVALSYGVFGGGGFDNQRAHAVELRLAGPLKAAAALTGNDALARTARRLDLRWTRATTFVGTPNETTVSGFSLVVRR